MTCPPTRILFVCYGNICRSPTAECIVQTRLRESAPELQVEFDSAGTSGMHSGKLADPRTRAAASKRGYEITSRARQFSLEDLDQFDLVVVMDRENEHFIRDLVGEHPRVCLYSRFLDDQWPKDVPDPYYGGEAGFEYVIDMIEAGVDSLAKWISAHQQKDRRSA